MKHTARFAIGSVCLAGIMILTACSRQAQEAQGSVPDEPTPAHSSSVVSVETGERPHCEAGTFTYTEKTMQLTGTQTTACVHGKVGYMDVRRQYARDVSGSCDVCGFHQEDVREDFWWGDPHCEEVPNQDVS